ncbi:MAG: hypothetical protein IKE03_06640, partial [Blautia sp.]|nr:hypothetical protein [Blautia sp.]
TDLFSEAGVDIKCFGIWTIEEANAVRLSLWIENRSGQDLKISLFNGTAGGRKADIKLPYDRLGKAHSPLYAGTGYYAHADFSPQEGTLDQWRGLPAKLSMMILLEGTEKKIYELEISTFGVMQWDRPVQKLIENERTMSKVSLYADLSSDEPFTCEEVIFPETSPQPKTLMLRVPSDKAQDVSKVTGMVSVDLSEHPEYKEDVEGYLALRPLVYVNMEKSNTGTGSSSDSVLYTGKFSDTVLTINRNPDQVVHTVENWPEASLLNGTVFAIPREEFSSLVHGVVPILTITMSADLQERTGRIKVTADEKNQDDEILYFKKLEFDQLLLPRLQGRVEENGLLRIVSGGFVWTLKDESEEETLPLSLTWIPYSSFEGRPCVEYCITYKDSTQDRYLEYLD